MASRFLGKSWFRLRPLVDHKVIPEPTWLKVAERFPPLSPPGTESNQKSDIRNRFPEELERRKIDEKYRMNQTHLLRETETGGVYGREEMRKGLQLFLDNGMKEETAWDMAVKRLRNDHGIISTNVEEEIKIKRLLRVKQLIKD